jgi:hypothetical protein
MSPARADTVSDTAILSVRAADLPNAWPIGQLAGVAAEFAADNMDHAIPAWQIKISETPRCA